MSCSISYAKCIRDMWIGGYVDIPLDNVDEANMIAGRFRRAAHLHRQPKPLREYNPNLTLKTAHIFKDDKVILRVMRIT